MAELRIWHEARVAKEEIDHLGHMNVRFYLEKALRATRALLADHGLGQEACRDLGGSFELRDVYTRHLREQLVSAPLVVRGGVLSVDSDGLRLYHELVNTENDELAAAFVHGLTLCHVETGEALPLPEIVASTTRDALVEWPERGRPRSLDLDHRPPSPGRDELLKRGLATRKERVIREDECDESGAFVAAHYQDLVWGGEPLHPMPGGMPLYELEGGGKFGWATLESRGLLLELPRAGARIQSFGAEVEIANKTSVRHQWVVDLDRDELLCTSSIVNLAFDIGARRAIEIPPRIREMLTTQFQPDLR